MSKHAVLAATFSEDSAATATHFRIKKKIKTKSKVKLRGLQEEDKLENNSSNKEEEEKESSFIESHNYWTSKV